MLHAKTVLHTKSEAVLVIHASLLIVAPSKNYYPMANVKNAQNISQLYQANSNVKREHAYQEIILLQMEDARHALITLFLIDFKDNVSMLTVV